MKMTAEEKEKKQEAEQTEKEERVEEMEEGNKYEEGEVNNIEKMKLPTMECQSKSWWSETWKSWL